MHTKIKNLSICRFREREIPQVPAKLELSDRHGSWKARWGFSRMNYSVEPGIYAVGRPDEKSPVMVSANYKMSFDHLRHNLKGIDSWILVLDTRGINVWCAAGKGTFGTDELVRRIGETGLGKIVDHRKLIVPQLGATGVSAHKVKKSSGFSVIYGPVRADDIPAFVKAGMKATPEMRIVRFTLADRVVLIPVEFVGGLSQLLIIAVIFFILAVIQETGFELDEMFSDGARNILYIVYAYLWGTILGPILLPWLPGRAFSVKGLLLGLVLAIILLLEARFRTLGADSGFSMYSWLFTIPALTSFILMNFTGASTFTSLSGVLKEMKIAIPLQITGAIIGLGLWVVGRFV